MNMNISKEIHRVIWAHRKQTGEYPERLIMNVRTFDGLINESRQVMAFPDRPGVLYFEGVPIEPFRDPEPSIELKIRAIGRA